MPEFFFEEERKFLAIPLYISAATVGYSRVRAKKHTNFQVISAVILSELVVTLNHKLNWSNEYRATEINFGPGEFNAKFSFKL